MSEIKTEGEKNMPENIKNIQNELSKIIVGKKEITDKILMAILARGHVLLEDVPGVGKTTTALGLSKILGLDFRRIQFTPDVVPSDVTGFTMYDKETGEFRYRPGAVMCNMVLADEINRTSPKTQSALLEIMEEGSITVDGVTHPVPSPFIVIATENPIGSSGTQLLPESQLDRFMICTSLGYPSHQDAITILKDRTREQLTGLTPVLTAEELITIRRDVQNIHVADSIYDYIVTLTEHTRTDSHLASGASPRASLSLLNMAKAMAFLNLRDYVIPEDIITVLPDVFGHRIRLSHTAKAKGMTQKQVLERVIDSVALPATTAR